MGAVPSSLGSSSPRRPCSFGRL